MDNVFIKENNYHSDTDSDTSTTSEAEEYSNLNNKLIELRESLIQPISGKDIMINDETFQNNFQVNDSFEIIMLRLLHLLLNNDGVINFDNLKKYMMDNKKECDELFDFFLNNPGIMQDKEFYSSQAGLLLRNKWVVFLSNREFDYIKNGYQISSSLANFYKFFEIFFPKINQKRNFTTEQDKLNYIYSKLNFNFDSLRIVHGIYNKINNNIIHSGQIQNIVINDMDIFVIEFCCLKEINSKSIVPISSYCEF
jgi:hypothetical protein